MPSTPWQLHEYRARLHLDGLEGQLNLLEPDSGLRLSPGIGDSLRVFRVELPGVDAQSASEIVEGYIRGNDLVATYSESATRKTRGQVYWRAMPCGELDESPAPSLELIASVQTSLLDSDPTLNVRSDLAAGEVFRIVDLDTGRLEKLDPKPIGTSFGALTGLGCFGFVLVDGRTYVEMVHPLDFVESELHRASDGRIEIAHRLFRGRLEKGVILRSRVHSFFLPEGADLSSALECLRQFAASEPVLTT